MSVRRVLVNLVCGRHFATALYVSGQKAQSAVSILTPSMDHVDALVNDPEALERNLAARNMKFDVRSFQRTWKTMRSMSQAKNQLEDERSAVSVQMKQLASKKEKTLEDTETIERLKKEGKNLREKLKELHQAWSAVEERAMNEALSLPNTVHAKTPSSCTVLYRNQNPKIFGHPVKSHIDIALENNWLKYTPTEYYLRDVLALWELKISQAISKSLRKLEYNYMAAPDFAKSIIVDGCGYEFSQPEDVYVIKAAQDYGSLDSGSALHLVGGASLPSFAAFFAKNLIESPLPVRFCGIGRQYSPPKAKFGLLNAAQATCVQFLSCVENDANILWEELLAVENGLKDLLMAFNVPFRIVALSPNKLEKWEQYRSSIQVHSPYLNDYVEIGNISIVGDYISRRLAVYMPHGKHPGFVTGSALNVVKFLACLLENRQKEDGTIDFATMLSC